MHRRGIELITAAYDVLLFADTDVFDADTIEAISFVDSYDEMAARGITSELRAKLAEAVKVATSAARVEEADRAELAAADEKYVRALGELRDWYDEWSRVARVVVKRRDHLILLGLAQRKSGRPGEPEPTDPTDE